MPTWVRQLSSGEWLDRGRGGPAVIGVLIAYRAGHSAVFVYGFPKREGKNIEPDELRTLREICRRMAAGGPEGNCARSRGWRFEGGDL